MSILRLIRFLAQASAFQDNTCRKIKLADEKSDIYLQSIGRIEVTGCPMLTLLHRERGLDMMEKIEDFILEHHGSRVDGSLQLRSAGEEASRHKTI